MRNASVMPPALSMSYRCSMPSIRPPRAIPCPIVALRPHRLPLPPAPSQFSQRSRPCLATHASASEGNSSNANDEPVAPPAAFKTLKAEAQHSNEGVYDRLIEVFLTRSGEEWRKLIAHSTQWPTLAQGVLTRMEERAKAAESDDNEEARRLRRTARRLKTVNDEMSEYSALITKFRDAASRDWESLVAYHRTSLNVEFFNYVELRVRGAASAAAAAGAQESREAEALAALGAQLAALVEAHDRVLADDSALDSAGDRFADLLQSDTMEVAEAKLDELAASGQLDPALLLTMAKAYAGVKETDATQEEVKDIMAHLYFKAKESFAKQAPPEARILKFLLAVESPADRLSLMEQAFQPGPEITTSDEDYLFTTPQALMNTVDNVLGIYDSGKGESMAGQAAALMNPEVIDRLRELQQAIRKKYL